MKRFSASLLLLCLPLLIQPVALAADCNLTGPESAAVGEVVTFTGTGFIPGSIVLVFVGGWPSAGGTVSDGGQFSVAFPFTSEGVHEVAMFEYNGKCADKLMISIGPAADGTTATTPPQGFVEPLLTPTTLISSGVNLFMETETLILSGFNPFDEVIVESDDVQPPQRWEAGADQPLRWEAALAAAAAEGSAPAAGGASSGGVSSDGSDGAPQDGGTGDGAATDSGDGVSEDASAANGTDVADSAGVAASPADSASDPSVLLLGVVTGLAAIVAGLGFGWLLGRRRS